jgi:hypothetical protein
MAGIIAPAALGYDAAACPSARAMLLPMNFTTPELLPGRRRWQALLCSCAMLAVAPASAQACANAPQQREASAQQIQDFVRSQNKRVLTFVGYSGAEYQDPAAMRAAAEQVLSQHDPARTLVNIGGTASGIGAVYELAKRRGFGTMGIVSTLARDGGETLSPCVDWVFFVRDDSWGGLLPGSTQLAPTSTAIVAVSHEMVAIGGGEIARDELRGARQAGKLVSFLAADMNHRIAIDKAAAKGQSAPTDFAGAAAADFARKP